MSNCTGRTQGIRFDSQRSSKKEDDGNRCRAAGNQLSAPTHGHLISIGCDVANSLRKPQRSQRARQKNVGHPFPAPTINNHDGKVNWRLAYGKGITGRVSSRQCCEWSRYHLGEDVPKKGDIGIRSPLERRSWLFPEAWPVD